MSTEKSYDLKRVMRLSHATSMVVGIIIGASIFVQPSEITSQVSSVRGVFLVWILSGLLTFLGATVCATLATIFTGSGGVYVYLKETYSPSVGFLWGWAMFWSMHSGIIAAIAVIFARYFAYLLPMGDSIIKVVAISVIVLLSAVNYIGIKQGSAVQILFTYGKIIAILVLIAAGFILGSRLPDHFATGGLAGQSLSAKTFLTAMVAGLFAFGGWHMVTYNAGEIVNPLKTIPRALFLGTLIVTVCYILLNAAYMYVLPLDVVASSKRIAADAADVIIGRGGGVFLSGLVMFSTFGAVNGVILCGPRVYYAMAQDGLLFGWIGHVHPRFRTPHKAIVLQAIWSSILVATGTYRTLFTRVVYTEWIFFGLMAMALFIYRRKSDTEGTRRIWGYPVVPALFIGLSYAVVVNQFITDPLESLFGFSLVLIGLPVYYFWTKQYSKRSTAHDYR